MPERCFSIYRRGAFYRSFEGLSLLPILHNEVLLEFLAQSSNTFYIQRLDSWLGKAPICFRPYVCACILDTSVTNSFVHLPFIPAMDSWCYKPAGESSPHSCHNCRTEKLNSVILVRWSYLIRWSSTNHKLVRLLLAVVGLIFVLIPINEEARRKFITRDCDRFFFLALSNYIYFCMIYEVIYTGAIHQNVKGSLETELCSYSTEDRIVYSVKQSL